MPIRATFIFMVIILATGQVFGQLSFCNGVGGPLIYNEDFGQGTDRGPKLPAGVTNYKYTTDIPQDGFYTIGSNMHVLPASHDTGDHTGNKNGKALIVNADFSPGLFYQTAISGLCENTTYEFSAWLLNSYNPNSNTCPDAIPINVRFEIWDATDTRLLKGGNTGDIKETATPHWQQQGLTFTTEVGQGKVILKMINNGAGGCGNDLAIDDIQFKTCGDNTAITTGDGTTSRTVCLSNGPQSETLYAAVKSQVYASPIYQWQMSRDGTGFMDIPGEDGSSYTTGPIDATTYYRARVAEDVVNLNNNSCNNYSSVFEFRFAKDPAVPVSSGTDLLICDGIPITLKADPPMGSEVDWYDSPAGGTLLASSSGSYEAPHGGSYYAESRLVIGGCVSQQRTAFVVREGVSPKVSDQTIKKCPGEQITLQAGALADSYSWSTGEQTPDITVKNAGTYTVTLATTVGCQASRSITVINVEAPVIEDVVRNGNFIQVQATGNSSLRYSLDGFNFQESNEFALPNDPIGTVYVMDERGCATVERGFQFLIIPDYFTPNGDGFHDLWTLRGLRVYKRVHLNIFDRFGKLLKQLPAPPYQWDGIYRGRPLPSSTYWYLLEADDKKIHGKMLLKR